MSITNPREPRPELEPGRLMWVRSSYSNGAGGECVECALTGDDALIRDSKRTGGPVIAVRREPWRRFVQALAGSELP
ncbi:DUF397 domain-containing protein [Streptomyces echinoruber]|uniref:DUF397 domain-containing protein n=1 Tax=Streptomyces echinoruber TaxID=68898 RepID=A0A918QZ80_9ACTN|nr:hypothetical protein GCM10010389_16790 [Streptomyces echinoruber]